MRENVLEILRLCQKGKDEGTAERLFSAWKEYILSDEAESPEILCREIYREADCRHSFEWLLAYWIPLLNCWYITGTFGDHGRDFLKEGVYIATQSQYIQWQGSYFASFYASLVEIERILGIGKAGDCSVQGVISAFCSRMNNESELLSRKTSLVCFRYIDLFLREEWDLEAPECWWKVC